uniref:Uncharacterized protein n=1 Tax=Nelumbo nucifera TaxID=4432 RepID=A0A822XGX6_NELNU|nr:TPA_asm: hypothetical protein HUJ06_019742 [Nelumbo nucifera]
MAGMVARFSDRLSTLFTRKPL